MSRKQYELTKYAIMIKKMKKKLKKRSTKIKKPLVEYTNLADKNLYITGVTGGLFPSIFTETVPEFERNKKNLWQSSKIHCQLLKKTLISYSKS